MLQDLRSLFIRDLNRLNEEIDAFERTEQLWQERPNTKNSAGNLCLHICGNLQHFVGHVLGNSGYQRDREHEFAAKDLSKSELQREIETTKDAVELALERLTEDQLGETYPLEVFGSEMSTSYFLLHLSGHLNYHLGQINYYRRLI